jgi:hypothetical protein
MRAYLHLSWNTLAGENVLDCLNGARVRFDFVEIGRVGELIFHAQSVIPYQTHNHHESPNDAKLGIEVDGIHLTIAPNDQQLAPG